MEADRQWVVVEAREGKGIEVELKLASPALGFTVLYPVRRVRAKRRVGARVEEVTKRVPLFGRYVFVAWPLTDSQRNAIRHMAEVQDFLYEAGSDALARIDGAKLEAFREAITEARANTFIFAMKDKVEFVAGPFAGCVAVVDAVDKRGNLDLTIAAFDRPVVLRKVEPGYVKLLERASAPRKTADRDRTRRHAGAHAQ